MLHFRVEFTNTFIPDLVEARKTVRENPGPVLPLHISVDGVGLSPVEMQIASALDPTRPLPKSCAGAVMLLGAAALGVVSACGTPEPGEPLACAAALLAYGAASDNYHEQCGMNTTQPGSM